MDSPVEIADRLAYCAGFWHGVAAAVLIIGCFFAGMLVMVLRS